MKHGDKAKAKSAKSSRKTSDEKTGSKAVGKGRQASPAHVVAAKRTSQTKGPAAGKAVVPKALPGKALPGKGLAPKTDSGKAVPTKASGDKTGGSVKAAQPGRTSSLAEPGFGNPTVAAAFKRAIKKYPNAFRRLTD